jgi:hypothetical protein
MSDLDGEEPRFVTDDTNGRLMACPYYSLNPKRHVRCLGLFSLRRYSDVKQHVLRHHITVSHNMQITPELPELPLSYDSDNCSQTKIVGGLDTI